MQLFCVCLPFMYLKKRLQECVETMNWVSSERNERDIHSITNVYPSSVQMACSRLWGSHKVMSETSVLPWTLQRGITCGNGTQTLKCLALSTGLTWRFRTGMVSTLKVFTTSFTPRMADSSRLSTGLGPKRTVDMSGTAARLGLLPLDCWCTVTAHQWLIICTSLPTEWLWQEVLRWVFHRQNQNV